MDATAALELADWRRRVQAMYAAVRAQPDPVVAHGLWRTQRDTLFRTHPQSPLAPDDPLRETGLPYWPYRVELRFCVPIVPAPPSEEPVLRVSPSASDGQIRQRRIGHVELPGLGVVLDVWWLDQYAGGLFLPVRDGTAGGSSYGGGRYLLDTAKGADLGASGRELVLDLNFLYSPSCRYDPRWECPLAAPGNTTGVPIEAGERL